MPVEMVMPMEDRNQRRPVKVSLPTSLPLSTLAYMSIMSVTSGSFAEITTTSCFILSTIKIKFIFINLELNFIRALFLL